MNGRDTDRVCSSNAGRAGCRRPWRAGAALCGTLLTLAGLFAGGVAAHGDGFDGFVLPQRGSQPAVRRPVRTADASVLVPPPMAGQPVMQVPGEDAGPIDGGVTVDGGWDPTAAGGSCLDATGWAGAAACGAAGTASGGGVCGACGGAGCGRCCPDAGLFQRLCGDACPRWVVQIDALMLWQSNIPSRPLFFAYDPTTMIVGRSALDVNQALAPMSAGPRVGLFYNLSQTYAIEGNYFQVRPFTAQAAARPGAVVENNLAGYTFPVDTDTVFDSANIFTRASIQSAELNWRKRECWCPITWLAGFRWVEWDQQLHVDEVAAGNAFTSLFRTDTINNLYGGQVGMDLGLWTGSVFNVNGIGKAGLFLNQAAQASKYQDSLGYFDAVRAEADGMAFFGEVGVNGSLQLTPWLAWRLGYSLFWLSGVAVPANQLAVTNLNPLNPTTPTARLNADGSVLLQGVTTGLEARW